MRAGWTVPVVTVVVAVFLAAGCGSSTPPPAAPPPETVTVTAAPPPVSTPPPAAGTTPASAPASDTPNPGGPPRCTTAGLRATLGAGEGAAGSVYRPLVFTNTSAGACELRGFPGVSYVAGTDGHQVGPAAAESGQRGGQVVLRPGGEATAQVQFVQVVNFDAAVCRPTPVRGIRVYPPGDTASLFVEAAGTGCAGTPPGPQLSVQTVQAR